ncbi:hypothetical protein DET57_11067 [Klebsiella oxytoca]|uniref:Uncharacterized protein n=1 Tax=Klebsiella oxytoca TaxID=571 RepID=A0A318FWU8_KLEOX|nr:hypothetical protein DET57_11067 [Klebsiella oxytoca]
MKHSEHIFQLGNVYLIHYSGIPAFFYTEFTFEFIMMHLI